MGDGPLGGLASVMERRQAEILADWTSEQLSGGALRSDLIRESELRTQSEDFLAALRTALAEDDSGDMRRPAWAPVRDLLASISRSRALQGFTPTETALFIFSLKRPLLASLPAEERTDGAVAHAPAALADLLDRLGLFTVEAYQKNREEVIIRQQQELLELSTPVVSLWEGILAVPLIGTLDSSRTQVVMENLLQRIIDTNSRIAIIDITGVPTVDTLVAQHLLKTVAAARLMGADCIISGIRPQIAQTIVHLGVDLGDVTTKATLADAVSVALQRTGFAITGIAPVR